MKCIICGMERNKDDMHKPYNHTGYVCRWCTTNKDYFTKNTKRSGKKTKSGFTYGFEFECKPINKRATATMMVDKFVPTRDCSLNHGMTELKSPIFYSKVGLKQKFEKASKLLRFDSQCCGQHIHIGNAKYNSHTKYWICCNYGKLFKPLSNHIASHKGYCEKIFGRAQNHYAKLINDYTNPYDKYNFINVQHNKTIEFRLAKFVTAEQYYNLVKMCEKIMKTLIDGYNKGKSPDKVGDKILKIYLSQDEK